MSIFMCACRPEFAEPEGPDKRRLEPEKMVEWCWFALDSLPEPLFLPLAHWVEQNKKELL